MTKPNLILILGGARAGKSSFALRLARQQELATSGTVCCIATAEALDEEMRERIARHRAERPVQWLTIEEPRRLDLALDRTEGARIVIVDCLTLFVSNWLTGIRSGVEGQKQVKQVTEGFLTACAQSQQSILCVSNEVGLGLVPETPLGRQFRDLLGWVNQRMAEVAAQVYLLVAGVPLQLKPGFGRGQAG